MCKILGANQPQEAENGESPIRQHYKLVPAVLNEDCLNRYAHWAMKKILKNRHGNTVSIVVRGGNTVHMAKGGSLSFNTFKGRMCETLREPLNVLKSLTEKACNAQYKFERLYRNLYNPEFYYLAYRNIYASQGNMTPGSDGQTIDDMSEERIQKIIESLKSFSYHPNPARRTYIAKKNSDKKRPLGIPSADDKLVQEIVRMILESIYEPGFSYRSHGFRPKKSCHTALLQIKDTFTGVKWFVEGDIKACFDSFDHHVLIEILRRRIADENFLALMWKFLRAGYMEQWTYHKTYSGTPQGSGVSPILANIYLNELDVFMERRKTKFDCGMSRTSPEYQRINSTAFQLRKRNSENWESMSRTERQAATKEQRVIKRQQQATPSKRQCDNSYKRIQYCRYADDFIIGVIGSKEDAEKLKADLKVFLAERLKLTLSDEKTKITYAKDKARFLSYDVTTSKASKVMKNSRGVTVRCCSGVVNLYVPKGKWFSKLIECKAIKIVIGEDGKERWVHLHRGPLINRKDIQIIEKVNSEIRGMYNYYCIANNATVISKLAYNLEYSMYKTFARKYKSTVRQVIRKYNQNGVFRVPYETKQGKKYCEFYNKGFKRVNVSKPACFDTLPQYVRYDVPNTLKSRLMTGKCELCGCESSQIRMHHVRKLKELKGANEWERLMLERRRKTLAVCPECHAKMHN